MLNVKHDMKETQTIKKCLFLSKVLLHFVKTTNQHLCYSQLLFPTQHNAEQTDQELRL